MSVPLFVGERSKPKITTQQLSVGCLIYEQMDQIDLTGPFEVLSRMPDTSIRIIAKEVAPVRDVQGLRLSPDASKAEGELFDVLVVPGGYGQQALMHDQEVWHGYCSISDFEECWRWNRSLHRWNAICAPSATAKC